MKIFNKYKEIEIASCILSGHHGLKLNNINRNGRNMKTKQLTIEWKLDQGIKKKIKNILELMQMKTYHIKIYGAQWRQLKEGIS